MRDNVRDGHPRTGDAFERLAGARTLERGLPPEFQAMRMSEKALGIAAKAVPDAHRRTWQRWIQGVRTFGRAAGRAHVLSCAYARSACKRPVISGLPIPIHTRGDQATPAILAGFGDSPRDVGFASRTRSTLANETRQRRPSAVHNRVGHGCMAR